MLGKEHETAANTRIGLEHHPYKEMTKHFKNVFLGGGKLLKDMIVIYNIMSGTERVDIEKAPYTF